MENGNFVYKGWKCNGFLALVLILGGLALGVYAIVAGAQRIDAGLARGSGAGWWRRASSGAFAC